MAKLTGKCHICGKAMVEKTKPFCSSRCSLIDLGKWLGESYKLESSENDENEADLPDADDCEET